MGEQKRSFEIDATLTIAYNGTTYTVTADIEPVFTDEFPDALELFIDRLRDAQKVLWSVEKGCRDV